MPFNKVNPKQSFPELEKEILKKWKEENTFKESIKTRDHENEYVFYDGPPFATGLPHYGHILAGTIKDVVPRFWTMKGHRIERNFGWDCHGLPVENIVESELGLNGKNEILEQVGVEDFNEKCRGSVLKYTSEWEKTVDRMGRWVDFNDDYKTMNCDFMESIWWVFQELWKKDLIYKGMKPMHVCPRCVTPLSNFEVTQGYKDVTDTSATVKFKLNGEENTYLLAWTTTPWTVPGNVLLAIGKDIEYSKVKFEDNFYILATNKIEDTFKDKEYEIVSTVDTNDLIGKTYTPPFDSLSELENAFRIVHADFVTTEDGVGIVHCAGPYGEDDMMLCIDEGVELKHHVNMDGTFCENVKEWAGKDCKKMDQNIVKNLEERNLLFAAQKYKHSYPHCWRCDAPLLNYATDSWFVRVTKIKEDLIKNNQKVNWVPGHIKEGRFGKWLEGAKDWAISRARFWGTPLPVWQSEDGDFICVGSREELEKLSGQRINDLHKHVVDKIVLEKDGKKYTRVEEVLDCWFESGSMPYAQRNYPFSEIPELKNNFYLMRHGESLTNTKEITSCLLETSENYPLTEKGIETVTNTAKELKDKNIDFIYSSDFYRTKQTSKILSDELGLEVNFDERLREINFGSKFDGNPYSKLQEWPNDNRLHMPAAKDGETYMTVKTRMLSIIRELNEKYEGKNIVLVSHGEPIRQTEGAFLGLGKKELLESAHADKGVANLIKENKNLKKFDDVFPAEFIAEGQDQTRGWFYTLMVLSTALFNKPAFKNVVVNGIVLAEDGKKMSKRLKNYPDPMKVFEEYGADALRFYLLQSPVVRADDLRFSERGVKEIVKLIILPLWNTYSFFVTYANIDNWEKNYNDISDLKLENPLDKWIVSKLVEVTSDVSSTMEKYDLQKSTEIETFIDDLTNWYIRRSRRRFWKSENDGDKNQAYQTLHFVLSNISKLIAPFMPFISEEIFSNLEKEEGSVHLSSWPEFDNKYLDKELNDEVEMTRRIVKLGHSIRARKNIKVRQPLKGIEVGIENKEVKLDIEVIKSELNIKDVKIINDTKELAEKIIFPNAKLIGPKFGKNVQEIIIKAKKGEYELLENGQIKVSEFVLEENEYEVRFNSKEGKDVDSDKEILVSLDTELTEELINEGNVRDLIRYIQDLRKKADFNVDDRIKIYLDQTGKELIKGFEDYLMKETLATEIIDSDSDLNEKETADISDTKINFGVKL
jgi:isoleucyl-tRNA synthetase